jgi:hypothetical protein
LRKSTIRLYAPFIALVLAQALLVAFLPSRGSSGNNLAAGGFNAGSDAGDLGGGDATAGGDGSTGGLDTTGSGDATAEGGGGSISGGGGATASGGGGGGGGGGTGAVQTASGVVRGDTSHCKGDRQFVILATANPPCVPKFTGDNGGETYQGVTNDSIKVIVFSAKPNEQVDAILGSQGLAVPAEESQRFYRLAMKFLEKRFELYGRKIDLQFVTGDCPTTPPNVDKCNAEAQQVVKAKPFLVIWATPLYASVFDIWAKAGIPAFGGWQFDENFFNGRRPFRYDPFMSGTEVGKHMTEYFCKKMAKQNATHSGAIIHPQIGQRGQVPRKLGIVTPEIEANVLAAKRVAAAVKECNNNLDVPIFTYESDINRATEQTQATVSGLIQAKVTTVACMCDPIAPVFLTNGLTQNSYFPEFFIPGTQFMDADLVGRLYNKEQMRHAFGISTIGAPVPLDSSDAAKVQQDMGGQGHPCGKNGCGINWAYVNMLGHAIQQAGPNLNPLTLEKGLLTTPPAGGWVKSGKRPDVVLAKFGANDYTWLSDVREVYWSSSAVSPVDGERGAYVNVNGGERYELGQWRGGGLQGVPVEPQ